MLRFTDEQIVFQEVPGEVSLAFTIAGCPLGCKGCHSSYSWRDDIGCLLTPDYFSHRLQSYQGLISCVLFLGGEWQPQHLLALLTLARTAGLHTCLYTGLDDVSADLKQQLTYLKTGRWLQERGGLSSPDTNQIFTDLRTGECLNSLFTRQ
ncbi:MAG: anaerobic ribonucleoside-triphosphate reductase activating protein [Rheinheimera sp.]|uniref:anaerobic ribonucleoside-triphosphate reductase activating protein n=1 Tax=Arsukibacterium sp. UBA3155 TaxID=1946058 RepID=UPI000C95ECA1|nr:anaerobic ribonucleoside-triphosphate reductase activating protein [Arsukibacterium sp. UBA3155]MAD74682.1 anaerobic ribonucleoside-triphosphate reductase activating protein [Rheinheimera sp.]|tara:strand:+ start:121029 stop:121481 length:453 start_codon:yes stop_codon:yes gene_type:complete